MAADACTSNAELASRLASRSSWQLEQLAERTASTYELEVPTVRAALKLSSREQGLTGRDLKQTERLLGELPPLLVEPASSGSDELCQVAKLLVDWAELVPHADIGLALPGTRLEHLRKRLPDRVATMLREGLIHLRESGTPNSRQPGTAVEYDAATFARSQAELRLFEALEARPRTASVFRLNQRIESSRDEATLEIDLLSSILRLAVEVDGYHHFRDAQAYRRDRRKDLQLQHLGYVVVRVLASDVEHELPHVLELIDAAVEAQKGRIL
jgi:very-short-patch-repair endonuclease